MERCDRAACRCYSRTAPFTSRLGARRAGRRAAALGGTSLALLLRQGGQPLAAPSRQPLQPGAAEVCPRLRHLVSRGVRQGLLVGGQSLLVLRRTGRGAAVPGDGLMELMAVLPPGCSKSCLCESIRSRSRSRACIPSRPMGALHPLRSHLLPPLIGVAQVVPGRHVAGLQADLRPGESRGPGVQGVLRIEARVGIRPAI